MGSVKHKNKILDLFRKSPVLDYHSIERIIRHNAGPKTDYAKQSISNLIKEGEIHRLVRGWYSRFEDPELAVFCFKPAYLGLQDALSYRNLWEQETIPVIITDNKVRQGIRQVSGTNIMIRRITPRYMFGFEPMQNGDYYIPVSDVEKTLIDMIYYRQKIGENVLEKMRKRINQDKLNEYLKAYPPKINKKIKNKIAKY